MHIRLIRASESPIMCERHPVLEMRDGFLYGYYEISLFLLILIMFSHLFVLKNVTLYYYYVTQ